MNHNVKSICLNCHEVKDSAWSACLACEFKPTSLNDRTKAVLLSNHNYKDEQLKQLSSQIKQGQKVTFNEEHLAQAKQFIDALDKKTLENKLYAKKILRSIVYLVVVILVIILLSVVS